MKYKSKPKYIEAIQWNGTNLKEVIEFTGKHPKFDEWFPTWEDYEKRVKEDNNIFKLIFSDFSHPVEVGKYIGKNGSDIFTMNKETFEENYEPVA